MNNVRQDFPIFKQKINGKDLIYFDNAATTQKPQAVIDRMSAFYQSENANVHRGVHVLSTRADLAYENARKRVQEFIHAKSKDEIIFTQGTTDGINLIAHAFGEKWITAGDEIIISAMEHHANIVPWQLLCKRHGAKLMVIPVSNEGELDLSALRQQINKKTKLVSIVHISNTLGTINPIDEVIEIAHQHNVPVCIDAAQSIAHFPIDVQKLDCDFLVFSGHKMYGPTGIGVLYAKKSYLQEMPPFKTGGGMIKTVTFEKTEFAQAPYKFEAGTPPIAEAAGLAAAIDYLQQFDSKTIDEHEAHLLQYASDKMKSINGLRIIGEAKHKSSIISFVMNCAHPHDIASILDSEGIAARAGHHCTMPLMQRFEIPACARISFAFYNTESEIDHLMHALQKVKDIFQ